ERLEMSDGRDARIDLDADLRVRGEDEAIPDSPEEAFEPLRREVGRPSPPPGERGAGGARADGAGDPVDLSLERIQVGELGRVVATRDDHRAAAEETQLLAEREMEERANGAGR